MNKKELRQQLRTAIDKHNNSTPDFCPPDPNLDMESEDYKKAYDKYANELIDEIISITKPDMA